MTGRGVRLPSGIRNAKRLGIDQSAAVFYDERLPPLFKWKTYGLDSCDEMFSPNIIDRQCVECRGLGKMVKAGKNTIWELYKFAGQSIAFILDNRSATGKGKDLDSGYGEDVQLVIPQGNHATAVSKAIHSHQWLTQEQFA